MSVSLHVQNVGSQPNANFIRSMFEKYGEVQDVKLIIDKESDAYKDYCFVLMKEQSSAADAVQACNGTIMENRVLNVSFAKSRQEDKKAVVCFLCNRTGHYQKECRVPAVRESLGQPPLLDPRGGIVHGGPPRGGPPHGGPPRGGPPRGGPPRGGPPRGGFAAQRGGFGGGYSQGGYGASASGLVEPGLDEYGGYTDEFGGYLDAAGNYFEASQLNDNSGFGHGTVGGFSHQNPPAYGGGPARGSLRGTARGGTARGGAMRGRGRGGGSFGSGGGGSECHKCGEEGHFHRECPSVVRGVGVSGIVGGTECHKCGEEGHMHRECPLNITPPVEARPGDWPCEKCGNINFAHRTECNRCVPNQPQNLEAKPGDWICPREKCGNLNFARRTQCKKCSVSRPIGLGV